MSSHKRMQLRDLQPQFRRGLLRMPPVRLESRFLRGLTRMLEPVLFRDAGDQQVHIQETEIGAAKVRVYTPIGQQSGCGLIWIHGGGMITGRASMNDRECRHLVNDLGAVVVSVDYRLAPEHIYPAAIDDCYEAWLWLQKSVDDFGVDRNRIAIAGQSAGGGLAAALCQRVLDSGGVQPVAQCLFYPMLDDRTAARQELDVVQHLGWNNLNNRYGWSAYLGHDVAQENLPEWAMPARREELANLPPAWIGVGELDLFYEENLAYAHRLREAGVSCDVDVVARAPHAFDLFVPGAEASKSFQQGAWDFLRRYLCSSA
ncbi:Carboxylesterase NlhH [Zhongshania aliphaticivorans]|uniref:Carboxylesterase NlhH n=1 Tax=Zhongshania aliphaticivorans TaxID=1470434 RepID=A0A5S9NSD3_9GAMM|nr:alpha/beta hydrolase [Zhongshania aliphaticivorans]CAA0093489.1 Carboxylesterase NlhH [Zhongshania aliphaticivorans]CAA0111427.1 Carboxylesterase NlhH [Zhongshania aliphaticivorans]